MTLLIRGLRDIDLAIEAIQAVRLYLSQHRNLDLARYSAFESLIHQAYNNTHPVEGLLHQLATDAVQPKALYEWWDENPSVQNYSELLSKLLTSLLATRSAYELAEKRFSRRDSERIDELRQAQLKTSQSTPARLTKARAAATQVARDAGRSTLLEGVIAASGTALVPTAAQDAAQARLVSDLVGQHGFSLVHLRLLLWTWSVYETENGKV